MYTEFWVFIINGIISPALFLLDPWTIDKKYKQKKIFKEVKLTNNKCAMTQREANE